MNLRTFFIRALGGYTPEAMFARQQMFTESLDEMRQRNEALENRVMGMERDLFDIRDRRLIAHSVPDEDWTPAAMKRTLDDMTQRLEALAADAERRHKRLSDAAKKREADKRRLREVITIDGW